MATQLIDLSTTWVDLGTTAMLISSSTGTPIFKAAVALPLDSDVVGHPLAENSAKMLPVPTGMNWYARVKNDTGSVIVTGV